MRKKKGSLNISVEAIVILILAIVMLGLGLGFIRGMFGKVSQQIESKIGEEPEPPTPSSTYPLTLSRSSIIANPKTSEVIKVGFYNPSADTATIAGNGGGSTITCLTDFKNIPAISKTSVCAGAGTELTDCEYKNLICQFLLGKTQAAKCPYLTGVADTTGFPAVPVDKAGVCSSAGCGYDATNKVCTTSTGSSGSMFTCSDTKIGYTALDFEILSGETKTFNIIVNIPKEATVGTGLCKIEVGDYSTTLTLKVVK